MADADPTPPLTAAPPMPATADAWRPGDPRPDVQSMIRVDHAGEYGATRIYAGQLAVFGDRHPISGLISHMADQEARHRRIFDELIVRHRVRPTVLLPFWDIAGFALGAATALIGPKAAMACTAAVETEIDLHYEEQRVALGDSEPDLGAVIEEFQAEEVEHREIALAHGAEEAVAYPVMYALIRLGCKAAIAISKRI